MNIFETRYNKLKQYLEFNELKNKKILLTGGTGFFGIWFLSLFHYLNKNGYNIEVSVISRNPYNFLNTFPYFNKLKWLKFIKGNIKTVKVFNIEIEYIIHAATDTSPKAHSKFLEMFNNIFYGSKNILKIAKKK